MLARVSVDGAGGGGGGGGGGAGAGPPPRLTLLPPDWSNRSLMLLLLRMLEPLESTNQHRGLGWLLLISK